MLYTLLILELRFKHTYPSVTLRLVGPDKQNCKTFSLHPELN